MKKMKEVKGKISRFELGLIVAVVCMLCYIAVLGINYVRNLFYTGNDTMLVEVAKDEARLNSNQGSNCVVYGCDKEHCVHEIGMDGTTVGYLDRTTKHIVGFLPKGYNESSIMEIDNKTYQGEVGTMVIQVKANQEGVSASWVKGKE